MIEFAYSMPIMFGMGMYGIEVSNLALVNMRTSQIALALADNASRVGLMSNLSIQQLREADINDIFQGIRLQYPGLNLAANGRVTLSSVEMDPSGNQWIHWQRCIGLKKGYGTATAPLWDSSYGKEGDTSASKSYMIGGMGPTGSKVMAPDQNSAVMFVEINYAYQPVIGPWLLGPKILRYTASFIVRDKRDLDHNSPSKAAQAGGVATGGVYNPSPQSTAMTCDKWTT